MWEKMLRWFTDKKGSAMVLVIVAIVILSTLGLAILSLSVTNLKVSRVDEKATLSFYMAESGLEQAHEIILNDVKTAVFEANKVVNDQIRDFIAAERNHMLADSSYKSEYIIGNDPAGPINVDKLKEKLQTPTDPEYQAWLNAYQDKYKAVLSGCLVTNVNNPNNHQVIDSNVSTEKPTIKVENQTTPLFNGNNCKLTVSSLFDKEEYLEGKTVSQKVEADFNIKVPDKIPDNIYTNSSGTLTTPPSSTPPTSSEKTTPPTPPVKPNISDNPIFDNVFVAAKKDMIFQGYLNLIINGNCYAYGTSELGGFILQNPKNNITINGDLVTYNAVVHGGKEMGANKSANAELKVNGNIYAGDLRINEGAEGARVEVNKGNVYTSKHLIMYGGDSTAYGKKAIESGITINKDWYGTTDSKKLPDSKSKIDIKGNKGNKIISSSINKEAEKKRTQFTELDKYIADVGEIIPKEIAKDAAIKNEVLLINNDDRKVVYVVGPEMHGHEFEKGALKVKLASTPTKGIIISKGPIIIYGTINFSGLIVSKQGKIEIRCEYSKTFNANRAYLKKKAYELYKDTKQDLFNIFPEGYVPDSSSTGDTTTTEGTTTEGTTTPEAGNIGIGSSFGLDPYKALISVGNWRKL